MPTKTVDVREAQEQLTELISLAEAGTEVILTDGAKPLARLVPMNPKSVQRIPGLHPGAIRTSDDFDEPLPDE